MKEGSFQTPPSCSNRARAFQCTRLVVACADNRARRQGCNGRDFSMCWHRNIAGESVRQLSESLYLIITGMCSLQFVLSLSGYFSALLSNHGWGKCGGSDGSDSESDGPVEIVLDNEPDGVFTTEVVEACIRCVKVVLELDTCETSC